MPMNEPAAAGSPGRYSERRKHPRIEARLKIRTTGVAPGWLTTENISLGGAFGETDRYLSPGSRLHCVLTPPRHAGVRGTVEAVADVLRSNAAGEGGRKSNSAAIRFVEIGDDGKERLRDLLRRLSGIDYVD